jgi:NADPH2:quinone reductase
MIESGAIRPPVGATYPFDDFGLALTDLEQRRALGKLVVRVLPG